MKQLFSKFTGLAALTLALQGCAYNLRGTPEENAILQKKNEAVLNNFFTPAVAQELKKIPVHYAVFERDTVVGSSCLSGTRAMLDGVGYEKITVYNITRKGKTQGKYMLHENIHHVQELEKSVGIERNEFRAAWNEMNETKDGKFVCGWINVNIYRMYGGLISKEEEIVDERMGWIPYYLAKFPDAVSESMRKLYKNILQSWVLSSDTIKQYQHDLLEKGEEIR